MYYRAANICIVVYDITDRVSQIRCHFFSWTLIFCFMILQNSFDAVQNWIKELRTYITDQKCLIAMAGNKCDLSVGGRRAISAQEAKTYADSVGAYFVETSAQTGVNVNELFITNGNCLGTLQKPFVTSFSNLPQCPSYTKSCSNVPATFPRRARAPRRYV